MKKNDQIIPSILFNPAKTCRELLSSFTLQLFSHIKYGQLMVYRVPTMGNIISVYFRSLLYQSCDLYTTINLLPPTNFKNIQSSICRELGGTCYLNPRLPAKYAQVLHDPVIIRRNTAVH